jgi:hypothetical protein
MQDRPTAPDLLAALRAFLLEEVAPALTDPRLRFRTLIAANVAAIVARELESEEERLRAEWTQLAALDDEPAPAPASLADLRAAIEARQRALCARIQAGEADADPWRPAAWRYARWSVEEKLRVANPRYLARFGGDDPERDAGG